MTHQALVAETGAEFEILEGETILEAARRANIHISHQCEIGVCATCRIKVSHGSVIYAEPIDGLTAEEIENGYVLACRAQVTSNLTFHSERRLPPCSAPARLNATVLEIDLITRDVYRLVVDPHGGNELIFRPGQYANFFIGDGICRSFSIASQSKLGHLEFFIKKIPEGIFTDKFLSQAQVGNSLQVEIPFGTFAFHADDYMPLIFAVTGTGIAPIKCMLDSLLESDACPPIRVYWGVRREDDLFLTREIAVWSEQFDDFEFIPVLSKPSDGWLGRVGHIQNVILDEFSDLSDFAIYLCGSPAMIRDATKIFCAAGANLSHLYADAFNFQNE